MKMNFYPAAKNRIPLRKPGLKADPPLPQDNSVPSSSSKNVDPYIVNYIELADQQISRLNEDILKLKEDLQQSDQTIESLKSQVRFCLPGS